MKSLMLFLDSEIIKDITASYSNTYPECSTTRTREEYVTLLKAVGIPVISTLEYIYTLVDANELQKEPIVLLSKLNEYIKIELTNTFCKLQINK